MHRVAVMSLAAVGLLMAGCEPNSSNFDPMGDAADQAGMTLTDVPLDQITSCVDSTKYGAYVGDADAQALWNSVGQSEDGLNDACTHIGRDDPTKLAAMHLDWTALQSSLRATP